MANRLAPQNTDEIADAETSSANRRGTPQLTRQSVNRSAEIVAKRRFPRRAMIGALCITALAGVVGYQFRDELRQRFWPRLESQIVQPQSDRVYALGRIEPKGEIVKVAGPDGAATARIKLLKVEEGDRVEVKAVLAVLDNEDRLLAERATAERRVKKAQAVVTQTRLLVETTRNELLASLESAKATREQESKSLWRQQRLRQSNATSAESAEQAQLQFDVAEKKVKEIEAKLARYRVAADTEVPEVLVALEDLAVAEASLNESVARLEQAYVRAPIAGTILDIHKHAGEPVGQGAVLDMGATDAMFARVDVYETDVPRLKVGQAVSLTSAAASKPWTGQVQYISSLVKKQSVVEAIPAANTDARVLEILVKLDEESTAEARKFIGLQVRAEFQP